MAAPTITLRVSKETEDALAALSEATGRPVGELVREGIHLLLDNFEEDVVVRQLEEARKNRDESLHKAMQAAARAKEEREKARARVQAATG